MVCLLPDTQGLQHKFCDPFFCRLYLCACSLTHKGCSTVYTRRARISRRCKQRRMHLFFFTKGYIWVVQSYRIAPLEYRRICYACISTPCSLPATCRTPSTAAACRRFPAWPCRHIARCMRPQRGSRRALLLQRCSHPPNTRTAARTPAIDHHPDLRACCCSPQHEGLSLATVAYRQPRQKHVCSVRQRAPRRRAFVLMQ